MFLVFLLSYLFIMIPALAQEAARYFPEIPILCSTQKNCPEDWPCCSQFGQCGRGPFCIGGCNPKLSHTPAYCLGQPALLPSMPSNIGLQSSMENYPALKSSFLPRMKPSMDVVPKDNEAEDLNGRGIMHFADYLISPQELTITSMLRDYHFTYSGFVKFDSPGQLTLAMPKHTSGSLLSSARSFLYGRSTVKMKTARGQGVVTAVVLISTVGDEIDFEFIGGELLNTQSNYYHQGKLNHTRMKKIKLTSDSFENTHIYEVDWDEDRIHWIVDGVVERTLYKEDTWNDEKQKYEYPQTPMRLQVSVWPGGNADADPGTIMWAGGLIDWEASPDIIEKGQYYAVVESVAITPYENQFWPSIVEQLEKSHLPIDASSMVDITYDYNYDKINDHTWFENSVSWTKGKVPYLSSTSNDGLNPGQFESSNLVDKKNQIKKLPEGKTKQRTSDKFIQDINKSTLEDEESLSHQNTSRKKHNIVTNTGFSYQERNPFRKLLSVLR